MSRDKPIFGTDAVHAELRTRSVRSSAVTVASRGAQMLLFLGSAMILARVLTPSDFGVQAMVLPVALLANSIANFGLQSAVIHRESFDSDDANELFRYAVRVNLIVAGAMAVLGAVLARFYDEPRVTGVALLWAATIYGSTYSAVQEALLKRQMRFGVVMKAQLAALLFSVVAAIGGALLGLGYWSLMLQVTVMEMTRVAIIWVVCPWRPSRAHRLNAGDTLPAVRRYWLSLSSSRAVSWIGEQLDRVVVGLVGGAATAGLYDSAKRWAGFAFQELFLSLTDVAVGSLSRVRGERERYRIYLRNTFLPILSLAVPVMAFMFVEARLVLHVLLGDQWLGAEPFVRMICIASVAATMGRLMQWVYMSLGQTDRQLRWTFVTTPATVLAVLVGARYGVYGIAVGVAVAHVTLAVPSLWYGLRHTPVTMGECLVILLRPLSAAAAGAVVIWSAEPYLPHVRPDFIALTLRMVLFGFVYVAAWIALPGGLVAFRNIRGGIAELRTARTRESGNTSGAPVPSNAEVTLGTE